MANDIGFAPVVRTCTLAVSDPSCAEPLVPNLARRTKLNEGADILDTVIQTVSRRFGLSTATAAT